MERKEKNIYDVALGSILKEYRQQNKMSLQNVADKIGVTKQMIFHYENGRSALTVNQLIKICNVYGVDYVTVLKQTQIKINKKAINEG